MLKPSLCSFALFLMALVASHVNACEDSSQTLSAGVETSVFVPCAGETTFEIDLSGEWLPYSAVKVKAKNVGTRDRTGSFSEGLSGVAFSSGGACPGSADGNVDVTFFWEGRSDTWSWDKPTGEGGMYVRLDHSQTLSSAFCNDSGDDDDLELLVTVSGGGGIRTGIILGSISVVICLVCAVTITLAPKGSFFGPQSRYNGSGRAGPGFGRGGRMTGPVQTSNGGNPYADPYADPYAPGPGMDYGGRSPNAAPPLDDDSYKYGASAPEQTPPPSYSYAPPPRDDIHTRTNYMF